MDGVSLLSAGVAMLSINNAATCLQLKPTGHEQEPSILTRPSVPVPSWIVTV